MIGLDMVASVYTEHPTTGLYTVLAKADLPCHFYHVSRQSAATSAERAELSALRHLQWDYDYVMPEYDQCQIEDAAGLRWNPVTGTYGANTFGMAFRFCDVLRAT